MAMTDDELCQRLSEGEADAISFNNTFGLENEENLEYYLGEPFGNEVPGQSSVVSTDCADVVEADMPSLARVFLGTGDIVTFQPNGSSEAEQKEVEEKTKYINWLVREQGHSFKTLHGWLKASEIQKMGVIKYFIEDIKTTKEVEFKGLSELEIEQTKEDLDGVNVKKIEVIKEEPSESTEDDEVQEFDITFRITSHSGNRATFKGVPTENFLITRQSESVDEAELVGDKMTKTRGELREMGVSFDDINKIPKSGDDVTTTFDGDRMKRIRFGSEGNNTTPEFNEWASEKVELVDYYVKIDFDEDGIAERRRILKARFAEVIIINDPFDHVPYALISSILMPHNVIGRSRVDVTKSNQLVKSTVLRGALTNLYLTNSPQTVVNDERVNIDDMLVVRPGGLIRTDGNPQEDVFPLIIKSVLGEALTMIQYLDFSRAQTTGTLMASQGLDENALANETATRFTGVEEEGEAKIELVARGIAETGFRKLYEGMAWMVSQFQDSPTEIMVLGKELTVDPSKWKFDHKVKSSVGLGAGDNEKLVAVLGGIYQLQQQLKAQGSALVDEVGLFNTLDRMVKGSGLPRTDEFFNNPEVPDELLKAQNEILTKAVEQFQQQIQQLQNPLAEAENIRAQAKLTEAQGKQQTDLLKAASDRELSVGKMMEDQRQFNADLAANIQKSNNELALRLTELEIEAGRDLNAQVQDNQTL